MDIDALQKTLEQAEPPAQLAHRMLHIRDGVLLDGEPTDIAAVKATA